MSKLEAMFSAWCVKNLTWKKHHGFIQIQYKQTKPPPQQEQNQRQTRTKENKKQTKTLIFCRERKYH